MTNIFVFLEALQNSQIHSEDISNIFDKAIKLYLEKCVHLKLLENSLMAICSRCKCTYFFVCISATFTREGQKQMSDGPYPDSSFHLCGTSAFVILAVAAVPFTCQTTVQ